jgi:hypothetical protein
MSKFAVRVTRKILDTGSSPIISFAQKNMTEEDALALEIKLISKYGRRDIGTGILTNCTDGGDQGAPGLNQELRNKRVEKFITWSRNERVVDDQYRARISDGLKEYHKNNKVPDDVRAKISAASSGKDNPFYGKKHSEDSRNRMSKSHSGVSPSEEHRKKISEALSGTRSGEDNPFFGKTHTQETKQRMSMKSKITIERLKEHGKPHWNYGRKFNEEQISKLKVERTCPHCGKTGRGSAMNRYHMDKCKIKVVI